jgi:hypothetical protein
MCRPTESIRASSDIADTLSFRDSLPQHPRQATAHAGHHFLELAHLLHHLLHLGELARSRVSFRRQLLDHEIVNGLPVLHGFVEFFPGRAQKTGFVGVAIGRRERRQLGGGHCELRELLVESGRLHHKPFDVVDFLERLAVSDKKSFHRLFRCLLAVIDGGVAFRIV